MSAPDRLVGSWSLVSFTERRDDGTSFDVFGPAPKGLLTYLASGHMSVVFGASTRTPYSGPWSDVSDRHKAVNYDGLVAYAGRYTDRGDRVVHHVDVCWIPNWEGRDLERLVEWLPEGRLRLQTPPTRFGRPQPVQDVIVERVGMTR